MEEFIVIPKCIHLAIKDMDLERRIRFRKYIFDFLFEQKEPLNLSGYDLCLWKLIKLNLTLNIYERMD